MQLKNISLPAAAKLSFTTSAQLLNYSDIASSGLMTLAAQTNNFTLRFTGAIFLLAPNLCQGPECPDVDHAILV